MRKEMILEAVNEMYNEEFKTFDEIFDFYTVPETIDAYLQYRGFGTCNLELWDLYTTFYNMFEKTEKELFD